MMTDEYKETVLHKLEKATFENEGEKILNRPIDQFPEDDLCRDVVVIPARIAEWIGASSEENSDNFKRKNILHALNYLSHENREKPV